MWIPNGRIDSIYSDYEKACRIAKKSNANLKWFNKLSAAFAGTNAKWIVTTHDVKD